MHWCPGILLLLHWYVILLLWRPGIFYLLTHGPPGVKVSPIDRVKPYIGLAAHMGGDGEHDEHDEPDQDCFETEREVMMMRRVGIW